MENGTMSASRLWVTFEPGKLDEFNFISKVKRELSISENHVFYCATKQEKRDSIRLNNCPLKIPERNMKEARDGDLVLNMGHFDFIDASFWHIPIAVKRIGIISTDKMSFNASYTVKYLTRD